MYLRKNSTLGSYYPTFLAMEVDTDESLELLLRFPLNPKTEALFLHEYIHYLQDLTTIIGYANISTIVDQMRWASNKLKGKVINVPITPSSINAYNIDINDQSFIVSKGDGEYKGRNPKIQRSLNFELLPKSMKADSKSSIHVNIEAVFTFEDEYGQPHSYKVGEHAISESMAYLIENHIYPGVLAQPKDCPYNIVRKVVELKKRIYSDDLSLIAICDACLMHPFPGVALFNILEETNTITQKLSPEELFFLGTSTKLMKKSGVKDGYLSALERQNILAKEQIMGYFSPAYWQNNKECVSAIFDEALEYRKKRPVLMLHIAQSGYIFQNQPLITTVAKLGCCAILTSANELYTFPPRAYSKAIEPDLFVAIHFMYKLLFTNTLPNNHMVQKCPLKEWCSKSFQKQGLPDITVGPADCDHFPWKNASKLKLLDQCCFGRVWATYGFQGKKLN